MVLRIGQGSYPINNQQLAPEIRLWARLPGHFKAFQIISKRKACSRRSGGLPGRGKCVRNVLEPVWRRSLFECTHKLGLLDSVRARFCGRRLLLRRFVSCRSMEIDVALVGGMRVTLPLNDESTLLP